MLHGVSDEDVIVRRGRVQNARQRKTRSNAFIRKGESGMIYIIEDDENIRNLDQVALNVSGYETAAFDTADEALGAFKVKDPQLAIFDLMMP